MTDTIEISQGEFYRRFLARMRDLLGDEYDDKYCTEIAQTYWDNKDQREDGPEECAESEFHEWGQE